jgi:pimeloyl-ACP methyl ester carboxylesterase
VTPADPPAWFTAALAAPRREGTLEAAGCPIHYLDWGEPTHPGLVMVHGGAAHAEWWSFLAPLLADRWRIVAPDLSGHGDSGRRPAYSLEAWVEEILALVDRAAFPAPPVLVGHSMGGLVAIQAAAERGRHFAGAVLVDAPLRRPDPKSQAATSMRALRDPWVYGSFEEAVARFRLLPEQPALHPHLFDYIARHSVRPAPGGWSWKFDPVVFLRPRLPMGERLPEAGCRLALLYGAHSAVVTPEVAAYTAEMMGPEAPVVAIPGAYHHLLLDQPLDFIAALRDLLLAWGHTG